MTNQEHGPPPKKGEAPKDLTRSRGSATTPTKSEFSNSSRQVSWWTVHDFVQHVLAEAGSWPMVGTPAWCALGDDDPVKIAAVYDAAQHHALRVDLHQQSLAESSRDISQAADWSQVATEMVRRESFYAARPWLRRVAS